MQQKRREWGYIHAHCGQQRAQRPGTVVGTTINIVTAVDGAVRTWPRRVGRCIGPDLFAYTLISLIVRYLIYS